MNDFRLSAQGIAYRTNSIDPKRRTICFIHGVSGSSSAWIPYENAFGDQYNIITLDLRGHGTSKRPTSYSEYALEHFAEDIYAVLQHLQIKQCIFVSHSFGVLVLLAFLRAHMEMASGLLFLSAHAHVGAMLSAKIANPFLKLGAGLVGFFPSQFLGKQTRIDYTKYKNTGDWNVKRTLADLRNTGLMSYLYSVCQVHSFDGADVLPQIHVPTFVVHGEKDTIFPPQYGVDFAKKIPGAEIFLVENADHILVLNHFPIVREKIERLASTISPSLV